MLKMFCYVFSKKENTLSSHANIIKKTTIFDSMSPKITIYFNDYLRTNSKFKKLMITHYHKHVRNCIYNILTINYCHMAYIFKF